MRGYFFLQGSLNDMLLLVINNGYYQEQRLPPESLFERQGEAVFLAKLLLVIESPVVTGGSISGKRTCDRENRCPERIIPEKPPVLLKTIDKNKNRANNNRT